MGLVKSSAGRFNPNPFNPKAPTAKSHNHVDADPRGKPHPQTQMPNNGDSEKVFKRPNVASNQPQGSQDHDKVTLRGREREHAGDKANE